MLITLWSCRPGAQLLEVPLVEGELNPVLVYPTAGQEIPDVDKFTVYGSTGNGRVSLTINGHDVRVLANGSFLARLPPPNAAQSKYELVARLGRDSVVHVVPVDVITVNRTTEVPHPDALVGSTLQSQATSAQTSLGGLLKAVLKPPSRPADYPPVVLARAFPEGPITWAFLPGVGGEIVGTWGDWMQLRIDSDLDVWVTNGSVEEKVGPVGNQLLDAPRIDQSTSDEVVDIVFTTTAPPAHHIVVTGGNLRLTLYGIGGDLNALHPEPSATHPTVARLQGSAARTDRIQYDVELSRPLLGYSAFWADGQFVLRLRRVPKVLERAPLRGLTIALDPGHPPGGSLGPTGLDEATLNLAVAVRAKELLERRGARVVMTRSDGGAVELSRRQEIAIQANAHALVSIHADARDGRVDAYAASGTRTYFFQSHAAPLARRIQQGLVQRMGLMDKGVIRSGLAMVRPTWMPAVLCEGAMLIIPEHEAALRTPEFQLAYARGIVEGLEAFFRAVSEP